jgi:transposase
MEQMKLTQAEREQFCLMKLAGQTIPDIAQVLGVFPACVRKWWRRGREQGMIGFLERKRGRPTQAVLSQFSLKAQ